jgi:dihydrofolate reductase
MPIFRSTPSKKIINGVETQTSEVAIVTDSTYSTMGESALVIKGVDLCELFLNSKTTDHVVIKALTRIDVKGDSLIDEEFDEVELDKGACVEFRKIGEYWYILSSDGMKNS